MAKKFNVQNAISGAVSNSELEELRRGRGLDGMLSQPDDNAGESAELAEGELTPEEQDRLARYETVIERGLRTFFEVGTALVVIRNERLYRAEHPTFEEYCRDRWGMGRNYVNKLVAANEVVANLGTIVPKNQLPANEAQARPLTRLSDPEQQRQAWEQVVQRAAGDRITARLVDQVVGELLSELTPARVEIIEQEPDGASSGAVPLEELKQPAGDGVDQNDEVASLRGELAKARVERNEAQQCMRDALRIIEEYQEHITKAHQYKPTSERGEAVSPFLRLIERIAIRLQEAEQRADKEGGHNDE